MRTALAFLVLVLSGSQLTAAQNEVGAKEQPVETVDFCDLFRYPARYDGKTVKVTATYVADLERAIFLDDRCKKSESLPEVTANAKFTPSTSGYEKLSSILRKNKLVPRLARVSIVAVFVDEYSDNHITVIAGRSRYTLEVTQVLAAERMTPSSEVGPKS